MMSLLFKLIRQQIERQANYNTYILVVLEGGWVVLGQGSYHNPAAYPNILMKSSKFVRCGGHGWMRTSTGGWAHTLSVVTLHVVT